MMSGPSSLMISPREVWKKEIDKRYLMVIIIL